MWSTHVLRYSKGFNKYQRSLQHDVAGLLSFRLAIYRRGVPIFFQARCGPCNIHCVPEVDLVRTKFEWHFLRTLKPEMKTSSNLLQRVFSMFHLRRISAVWPWNPKCHNPVLLLNLTFDFSFVVKENLKHPSHTYQCLVWWHLISISLSFLYLILRGHFHRFYWAFSIRDQLKCDGTRAETRFRLSC